MSLKRDLGSHLHQFSTLPFLFIGTGLSRRYLGLEDWEGLLRRFSQLTDRPYDYYRATADNYLPQIATEIAHHLHEIWWRDAAFADSRNRFSEYALTVESALKIEISRYMKSATDYVLEDRELLQELDLLRRAVFDGVITTNWDRFLEGLFPDLTVYVGQNELLFSNPQAIGEIYKIHGCCTQPNSLVLTYSDYAVFNERNPYLASKLLTIFVEHPILFLGYSLNDDNTLTILRSIATCLTSKNINQLRDRLIFVQWDPNIEGYEFHSSSVVAEGFNIPVINIRTASFVPIFEVLSELRRRFSARLLRELKEHVYELVLANDPSGNLHVQDIDEDSDRSQIDVVYGVGVIANTGYRSLTREDLTKDILFQGEKYFSSRVVYDVLPDLLKKTPNVPVFKYLQNAGVLDDSGYLSVTDLHSKLEQAARPAVEKFLPPASYRNRFLRSLEESEMSFGDVLENSNVRDALHSIPFLTWDEIPLEELREFLVSQMNIMEGDATVERTQFYKVVCLYDYLQYRENPNLSTR